MCAPLSFCYILSASVIYQLTPLSPFSDSHFAETRLRLKYLARIHSLGQFVAQYVANRLLYSNDCAVYGGSLRAHHLFHGQSLLLLLYIGAHSMSLVQCPRLLTSTAFQVLALFHCVHFWLSSSSEYSLASVAVFFAGCKLANSDSDGNGLFAVFDCLLLLCRLRLFTRTKEAPSIECIEQQALVL